MKKYILLFGLMSFYGLYSYTNAIECSFYEFEDQCVSPGGQVKMSETNSDLPHFTRGLDAKIFEEFYDNSINNDQGFEHDDRILWEWKANDDGEPDGEFKSCEDFEIFSCATSYDDPSTTYSATDVYNFHSYKVWEEWQCMEGACENYKLTGGVGKSDPVLCDNDIKWVLSDASGGDEVCINGPNPVSAQRDGVKWNYCMDGCNMNEVSNLPECQNRIKEEIDAPANFFTSTSNPANDGYTQTIVDENGFGCTGNGCNWSDELCQWSPGQGSDQPTRSGDGTKTWNNINLYQTREEWRFYGQSLTKSYELTNKPGWRYENITPSLGDYVWNKHYKGRDCDLDTEFCRLGDDKCTSYGNVNAGSHNRYYNKIRWRWSGSLPSGGYYEWRSGSSGSRTDVGSSTSKTVTGINCDTNRSSQVRICVGNYGCGPVTTLNSSTKDCSRKTGNWSSCSASPYWDTGDWSDCSVSCGGGTKSRSVTCEGKSGTRSRSVKCVNQLGSTINDSYCEEASSKPSSSKSCTESCSTSSKPDSSDSCNTHDCP
ncbi:thrombospondin type-1 domain-containing protein [Candidatus Vampirococcus lugosii]|nr:thrombospondin type-1 domain-containing protein [Candidatus Vampirococcus lugosii]